MIFVIPGGRDRTASTPTAESPSSCAGHSPDIGSADPRYSKAFYSSVRLRPAPPSPAI